MRAEEPPVVFSKLDYLVMGFALLVALIVAAYCIVSLVCTPEVVWGG